ncbi:MAG: VOC family protein [Acidobacteria bacterium]|nr:VOC family protein [Acidobacteriota bacterium]
MIDLVKLHHVSFAIRNLERSRKFFGEVLGLAEIERPSFRFPGAWYALADRQLHLIQASEPEPDVRPRISRSDHVALEVRDIEAVRGRLAEAGVEFREGGNRDLGMEQVFCQDPDGHVIEFVHYSDA